MKIAKSLFHFFESSVFVMLSKEFSVVTSLDRNDFHFAIAICLINL